MKTFAACVLWLLAAVAIGGGLYLYEMGRALCEATDGTCSEPLFLVAGGLLGLVFFVLGRRTAGRGESRRSPGSLTAHRSASRFALPRDRSSGFASVAYGDAGCPENGIAKCCKASGVVPGASTWTVSIAVASERSPAALMTR
jgi:hypothetical protein